MAEVARLGKSAAVVTLTSVPGRVERTRFVSRADAVEIYQLYARVCKAIADPKRLLIINELRDGPRTVGEVVAALGISQANASQHLAVLRDRGVVSARRAGSHIYYALTSNKIIQAVDLLCEFMAERQAISGTLAV